jgi:hypothetical protein
VVAATTKDATGSSITVLFKNKSQTNHKKTDGRSTMNNAFTKARGAYWLVIVGATLTFATHAGQGARSMKETPETSVKPQVAAASESPGTDATLSAAYRDGLYVGKLAAQRGEQRLAPVGRWSTQNDREAFLAGYEQSNAEIAEATGNN